MSQSSTNQPRKVMDKNDEWGLADLPSEKENAENVVSGVSLRELMYCEQQMRKGVLDPVRFAKYCQWNFSDYDTAKTRIQNAVKWVIRRLGRMPSAHRTSVAVCARSIAAYKFEDADSCWGRHWERLKLIDDKHLNRKRQSGLIDTALTEGLRKKIKGGNAAQARPILDAPAADLPLIPTPSILEDELEDDVSVSPTRPARAMPAMPMETPRTPSKSSESSSSSSANYVELEKNNKHYLYPKGVCDSITPVKPKMKKSDVQALKDVMILAVSWCRQDVTAEGEAEMTQEALDQRARKSLKVFDGVETALQTILSMDIKGWPLRLWTTDLPSGDNRAERLWLAMRYTLTDFTQKATSSDRPKHERTTWVQRIVPIFDSLAFNTGLIRFTWCEYTMMGRFTTTMEDNDFTARACKLADGLGLDPTTDSEIVIMEASSGVAGTAREHMAHTLEDTLKLLESCVHSLKTEFLSHKDASFATMTQRKILGVQYIGGKITLTQLSLCPLTQKWKYLELRSAIIPMEWSQRYGWIKVFELVATVFNVLLDQEELMKEVAKEENGAKDVGEEETVRHKFRK
ncbi:hypothetical protein DFS34DRAFT_646516 [Phlyctochytrium arcticum]|nr:hypothetical protein DFS34DRAFT_646516 [Phlyctochytrium arcticum]